MNIEEQLKEQTTVEDECVRAVRKVADRWKILATKERCKIIGKFAAALVENASLLHDATHSKHRRNYAETISSELLPLADAAKWIASQGARVLADRRVKGSGRPLFQSSVDSVVRRESYGVVSVIGTWNYPIFLVGVQLLQALAAGNGIVIKPAAGCTSITLELISLLEQVGVPKGLCQCVDESIESSQRLIAAGTNMVILTGSAGAGREVLARCAKRLLPAIVELSGCDSMLILDGADLDRAAAAVGFSMRLNCGATCMATRQIFIERSNLAAFSQKLRKVLSSVPDAYIDEKTIQTIECHFAKARFDVLSFATIDSPTILNERVEANEHLELSRLLRLGKPIAIQNVADAKGATRCAVDLDCFAPFSVIYTYDQIEQAIEDINRGKYGLTGSIFGPESLAAVVANQLNVGNVTINDLIAPSADPRLPFGGCKESGFGVTRGEEGLLACTRQKVITVNRRRWLPHLDPPHKTDSELLEGFLQFRHAGTWKHRLRGIKKFFCAIVARSKKGPQP